MEVLFISREIIKPSSPLIHHQKPFKLSLTDQLPGATYIPIILFYPAGRCEHSDVTDISAQLKASLSKTLSLFYFLSGRVVDNLCIDNYGEGAPFVETKVNCQLSDFLRCPQINMLNQFLPYPPYTNLSKSETTNPLMAIQVNTFECGGIALGVCFWHRVFDVASASAFLKSWSTNHTSGYNSTTHEHINPDLLQVSLLFPPIESSLLRNEVILKMGKLWFDERKRSVRRFVFDSKAIATLRTKARSENVGNPSRIETLTSFVWKSLVAADRKLSADSPRPSLLAHAVNIRQRVIPPLPKDSVGNAVVVALAVCDSTDEDQMELHDFVTLTRHAISSIDPQFLKQFRAEEGHESAFQFVDIIHEVLCQEPEVFFFTSWVHMGFNDLEFGWGKPLWSGVLGGVGPACFNCTIFKEAGSNGGDLEAWVILEEDKMSLLESDPEFLAFATPNPSILP